MKRMMYLLMALMFFGMAAYLLMPLETVQLIEKAKDIEIGMNPKEVGSDDFQPATVHQIELQRRLLKKTSQYQKSRMALKRQKSPTMAMKRKPVERAPLTSSQDSENKYNRPQDLMPSSRWVTNISGEKVNLHVKGEPLKEMGCNTCDSEHGVIVAGVVYETDRTGNMMQGRVERGDGEREPYIYIK